MPDDAVAPAGLGAHEGMLVAARDHGPVRVLTLNRPQHHNALVPELLADLRAQIALARAQDGVRALVLTGAGGSFSTGGDIAEFAARTGAELQRYAREIVGELNGVILDLLRCEVPVVTAVHGPLTGGSLGLILASDVTVVGPRAWFQPYYVSVGFSPDGGWTALLPDRVGPARALTWQLLNHRINADEALASGLATHYASDPVTGAVDLATQIAGHHPGALRATAALCAPDLAGVARRLEAELESFLAQIGTDEARRGMTAFLA